ncbi:hypothetical protein SARC_02101 [Sphaeroforma arctica JP610]|uniref:Uncharacterized protein n=1 Tax=Sphaeroforma arctica JP610 TaxID=667725 RepID=A0A0L0G9M0_9EUKA|nr:hypothetical protein SARC_02101 [Sphaeroforma arctica JP610]KNC85727.1 hypothetical protein SARC_02101 [Sphaeroforma arctica JP610]|eukprot:XP_014159629.1 hypothetical protein SARC_02101 [Sphaeroforma arctica JP610]
MRNTASEWLKKPQKQKLLSAPCWRALPPSPSTSTLIPQSHHIEDTQNKPIPTDTSAIYGSHHILSTVKHGQTLLHTSSPLPVPLRSSVLADSSQSIGVQGNKGIKSFDVILDTLAYSKAHTRSHSYPDPHNHRHTHRQSHGVHSRTHTGHHLSEHSCTSSHHHHHSHSHRDRYPGKNTPIHSQHRRHKDDHSMSERVYGDLHEHSALTIHSGVRSHIQETSERAIGICIHKTARQPTSPLPAPLDPDYTSTTNHTVAENSTVTASAHRGTVPLTHPHRELANTYTIPDTLTESEETYTYVQPSDTHESKTKSLESNTTLHDSCSSSHGSRTTSRESRTNLHERKTNSHESMSRVEHSRTSGSHSSARRSQQPTQSSRGSERSGTRSSQSNAISNNIEYTDKSATQANSAKTHFSAALTKNFRGHKDKIRHVAWSYDGTQLASASSDNTIKIWHPLLAQNNEINSLTGHTGPVEHMSFNPKIYNQLFTCSQDKSVRLWDTKTATCTNNTATKGENIFSAWSPDGKYIAFVNSNDVLTVVDVRKMDTPVKTQSFNDEVNQLSWNSTGEFIVLAMGSGMIQPIPWPSMDRVPPIKAHGGGCVSVAFDPKGRYLAVGSVDTQTSLWDLSEMASLRTFNSLGTPVVSLSFTFCGTYLASAAELDQIDISHVESGESVHQIELEGQCTAVAWHPSKHFLAYTAYSRTPKDDDRRTNPSPEVSVFGYKDTGRKSKD